MKTKFNGILTLLLAFVVQLTFAQEKTISGTVVDETNMPLPGATVVIKGTTTGTSTDFDGKYTIIANTGDVLTFSYVGYSEQDVTVAASNTIDIALALDNSLEEVVITAQGVKRKPDEITTANQVVKADELNQASNPNAVQSLAGKVSGLQINTTSTGLNPNTTIVLRGPSSISGNNSALVVIDNVLSSSGILATIDPNMIESINVIKGANGAALYGERGSAGVIIVTTKRGTGDSEKFTVDVKSSVTFESIAFLPETQDRFGQGWQGDFDWTDQGSWGPEYDGSQIPTGTPYPTANDWRLSRYENIDENIKPFFNTGVNYQNGVTVNGGNLDSGYITLSLLRQDVEGVIPGDTRKKNNFSLSTGKRIGKLTVNGAARYSESKTDRVGSSLYASLANTPGNINIESYNSGDNADHWTLYDNSPYWLLKNNRVTGRQAITNLSADLMYEFNDNINTVFRSSVRNINSNNSGHTNEFRDFLQLTGTDRKVTSNYNKSLSESRFIQNDLMLNFDYLLTDNITFKSNLGFNTTDSRFQSVGFTGNNLRLNNFYDLSNVSGLPTPSEGKSFKRTAGVYGQVDLGYNDYLFLNMTARNDWNSVLPEENRSFLYYSSGLAFIPTKAFSSLKGKILHKAKVSASYVKTGNAGALSPHEVDYVGVQGGGYPYYLTPRNSFLLQTSTADPNLENEFVTSAEFNVNLEFLNRRVPRITLDGSFSFAENTNQILNITTSSATGGVSSLINVGETKSNAMEIDLGFTPIKTDNFEWNGGVTYSAYKTTVEKVTDQSNSVNSGGYYAIEGQEWPILQGTTYTRDDQGRIVLDSDGNPVQDGSLKILGKTTPDYILNFRTQFKYKGIALSAVADYRTGHVFDSGIKRQLNGQGRTIESTQGGREAFLFPNSTIEGSGVTNTNTLTGGASAADYQTYITDNLGFFDENFVTDATAFKLREVSLSYDLPANFVSSLNLSRFTVGVSGRNLLTVLPAENRGYNDPEIGNGFGGYSATPPTKFYSFNVNFAF